MGCHPSETWGCGAHPCLLAGLSISCRVVAAALRHVHAHPPCPPCCPLTYLPFPSTRSSWVAASSLAFHGVGDTAPQILLSPAWTRAAPATSSWDVEDVPWDGTLGTDWAPVPPPSSPSLPASMWLLASWPGWVLPCLPLPVRLRTSTQHWPFCLFWLPSMGNVLFSGRISSAHISRHVRPPSGERPRREGAGELKGAPGREPAPWFQVWPQFIYECEDLKRGGGQQRRLGVLTALWDLSPKAAGAQKGRKHITEPRPAPHHQLASSLDGLWVTCPRAAVCLSTPRMLRWDRHPRTWAADGACPSPTAWGTRGRRAGAAVCLPAPGMPLCSWGFSGIFPVLRQKYNTVGASETCLLPNICTEKVALGGALLR